MAWRMVRSISEEMSIAMKWQVTAQRMLIHGRGWEQAGHRGEDGVDHARVQGAHTTSSHLP